MRTTVRRAGSRLRRRLDAAWNYWAPLSLDEPAAEPQPVDDGPVSPYLEIRHDKLIESGMLQIGQPFHHGDFQVLSFIGSGKVVIGRYCSIAHEVELIPGGNRNHRLVSTYAFRALLGLPGAFVEDGQAWTKGDIVIGNDVFIGRGAKILSGVTIGDGAVVAAFSVVTKDVRPYALVAGVPAREAKRRFPDDKIERLLAARWWDMPDEDIHEVAMLLSSEDVDALCDAVEAIRLRRSSRS